MINSKKRQVHPDINIYIVSSPISINCVTLWTFILMLGCIVFLYLVCLFFLAIPLICLSKPLPTPCLLPQPHTLHSLFLIPIFPLLSPDYNVPLFYQLNQAISSSVLFARPLPANISLTLSLVPFLQSRISLHRICLSSRQSALKKKNSADNWKSKE